MAALNARRSIMDKVIIGPTSVSRERSTPSTTPENAIPEDKSLTVIIAVLACIAVIFCVVCLYVWCRKPSLCCGKTEGAKPPVLAYFAMFRCCTVCFRHKTHDQTVDGDCQWRTGQTASTLSTGENYSRDDNPSGILPPVFYLESGDSTDTDSVHTSRRHTAKLDPNSELQRKSKLQNEKLPSFSALDRKKRPRQRKKEEGLGQGDGNGDNLVLEPLTFETFRSNSPPLAVIAPLSNRDSRPLHGHGVSSRSGRENSDGEQQGDPRTAYPPSLSSKSKQNSSGGSPGAGNSLPLLNIPKAYSENRTDAKRLQGRVNKAYSSEEDEGVPTVSPSAYTSDQPTPRQQAAQRSVPRRKSKSQSPKRPATLQLPKFRPYNSLSSVNSNSTLPEETSHSDSEFAETSDTQVQDPVPSAKEASDPLILQINRGNRSAYLSRITEIASKVVKRETVPETAREIHDGAEPSHKRKKTPPKKPKRKNPPSNVSTAESRDSITSTLMTSKGLVTSSEGTPRQKGELSNENRLGNGLLPPPYSFMDHVYAGFDDFDEVNGSLV